MPSEAEASSSNGQGPAAAAAAPAAELPAGLQFSMPEQTAVDAKTLAAEGACGCFMCGPVLAVSRLARRLPGSCVRSPPPAAGVGKVEAGVDDLMAQLSALNKK